MYFKPKSFFLIELINFKHTNFNENLPIIID
jgi:hypothetical protein